MKYCEKCGAKISNEAKFCPDVSQDVFALFITLLKFRFAL